MRKKILLEVGVLTLVCSSVLWTSSQAAQRQDQAPVYRVIVDRTGRSLVTAESIENALNEADQVGYDFHSGFRVGRDGQSDTALVFKRK